MGSNGVNDPSRMPAPDSQSESVPSDTQGEGGGTSGESQDALKLDDVLPTQETKDTPEPDSPEIALSQKRPPPPHRIRAGRWYSRVTLGISIVSLVVIIIHAYYYNEQWKVMTRQAELIERQIRQSTNAFTLQERAWIFMESGNYVVKELINLEDPNRAKANMARADLVFRNTGNTPALNTKTWFCVRIREQPVPDDAPKPQRLVPPCYEYPFGIVGPNASFSVGNADVERVVDPATSAKLDRNELKLYIWGVIEYEDFFQQRHMTRFCYTNIGENRVIPCENNNSAN